MNNKVEVTFLGTGTSQGVPFIGCNCAVCTSSDPRDNRLRSSVYIHVNGHDIIIDTGPDFRYQMLKNKIKNIDAVLYTHSHKDHIAGLDDIKAYNYWHQKPIDIFATAFTNSQLEREFSYIFSPFRYPGIPEINLHEISHEHPFEASSIMITPIRVMHLKMEVLGFRINGFTYITDANFISEEEKEKIKGSDVLVINALRHEKHISHFTLSEALALAEELEVPRVYLTHISHQLGLHSEVERALPSHIRLA